MVFLARSRDKFHLLECSNQGDSQPWNWAEGKTLDEVLAYCKGRHGCPQPAACCIPERTAFNGGAP